MKTVYLVRHSEPIKKEKLNYLEDIDEYEKNKNIVLSVNGIKKMSKISNQIFNNSVNYLYSSPIIRAIETANFISHNNLKINITDKFRERKIGNNPPSDFWLKQLEDENYKLVYGESRKEVCTRMLDGLNLVLKNMSDGEVSVIVSHGASITFLLLNWCVLEHVIPDKKIRHLTFNGKTVINDTFTTPEIFKLQFDSFNLISIDRIMCKD